MAILKTTSDPTPLQHLSAMRRKFSAGSGTVRRNKLQWRMAVQPTPLSDRYDLRFTYSLEKAPRVFVVQPELQQLSDEPIPHMYSDGSLCLYLPGSGEWDRSMLLSDTNIPWACEWLYFYELWLGTGTWCGGGHHPRRGCKVREEVDSSRPSRQ
jgi:hypothetical protein